MKQYIVGIIIFLVAASCSTERMICPAYQSAFIHDKATLEKKFSYFGEDSLPKILEASKDKHLLIDPVTYRKKLRSLQTVAMTDVYPQKPDSVEFDDDLSSELMLAERDVKEGDLYNEEDLLKEMPEEGTSNEIAASQDSVYVISLKKEKFNIDQELYLWYLRKFLVYPDVKLQMESEMEASGQTAKEEKQGFFKRLFGGKKKDKNDLNEETSATELEEEDGKKKKKFSLFGKKNKDKDSNETDEESTPEPVEEEDPTDGDEDF
ncbi:hypothetical protein [Fulvivirga lutea]|uniref:Uncharacterized protein n=1 Tax=Fulvivirga lutea TaxID=2810512 RepID=A0A974WH84_9BACT|nr:hypothetical protein [Fulvivirga lutea]QSE97082.1 hypothetical protein JR347_16030 [Fulvivirga lutea]